MYINKLYLENLRCIKKASLELGKGTNFFVGLNGSGKSTVLESIQVLATGKSFRTAKIENIKSYESNSFTIVSNIKRNGVVKKIGFRKDGSSFDIRIDASNVNRLSELARNFSLITFHANSVLIIDGEPQYRRRYIDWWLFHSTNEFYPEWLRYQRLLKQRNAALRKDINLLDALDSLLAESGEKINNFRELAVEGLMREFFILKNDNSALFGKFSWQYISGWFKNEDFLTSLKRNQQKDIQYGFTSVGPHRGDLRFFFHGKEAKEVLSRGQKKILSLRLLITLASIHKNTLNETPIFMIDDISAELDVLQRYNALEQIISFGGQLLLTAMNASDLRFPASTDLNTFVLQEGSIHVL